MTLMSLLGGVGRYKTENILFPPPWPLHWKWNLSLLKKVPSRPTQSFLRGGRGVGF